MTVFNLLSSSPARNSLSGETASAVVFAQGIRAYQADAQGTIALALRRSVEWLTAPDLEHRSGDAGPFMYVPDARCERVVRHEIAVVMSDAVMDELKIRQLNAAFQNPPLIVETQGQGTQTTWQILQESLPISGLHLYNDKLLARLFNPTSAARALGKPYQKPDVWGKPESTLTDVQPGQIVTVDAGLGCDRATDAPASLGDPSGERGVQVIAGPEWRVGDNQGQPDPKLIEQLETQIAQLEAQLVEIEAQLSEGGAQHLLQHRYYILKREQYEARLSAQLNRHKLTSQGHEYLNTPAPDIAELGAQLNQLRIKRRIYDYVVEAL